MKLVVAGRHRIVHPRQSDHVGKMHVHRRHGIGRLLTGAGFMLALGWTGCAGEIEVEGDEMSDSMATDSQDASDSENDNDDETPSTPDDSLDDETSDEDSADDDGMDDDESEMSDDDATTTSPSDDPSTSDSTSDFSSSDSDDSEESSEDETEMTPGVSPEDAANEITAGELQTWIEDLAADARKGRHAKSPEAKAVADLIASSFMDWGLMPGGDGGEYLQNLDANGYSPNVVALREGKGEDIWIITAHYDHLAMASSGSDRIFNGADDNASGTAALLEIAQAVASLGSDLDSTVVFIAFSAEEEGLFGSRYFVDNPTLDLDRVQGVFNMDMISRNESDLIFVEGHAEFPDLGRAVERANERVDIRVRFDEHPEWRSQSDHYSFIEGGIPAIYFGVEDHPDYHKVSDHADRTLPELCERVARLVFWSVIESDAMRSAGQWSGEWRSPQLLAPMISTRWHRHIPGACR